MLEKWKLFPGRGISTFLGMPWRYQEVIHLGCHARSRIRIHHSQREQLVSAKNLPQFPGLFVRSAIFRCQGQGRSGSPYFSTLFRWWRHLLNWWQNSRVSPQGFTLVGLGERQVMATTCHVRIGLDLHRGHPVSFLPSKMSDTLSEFICQTECRNIPSGKLR